MINYPRLIVITPVIRWTGAVDDRARAGVGDGNTDPPFLEKLTFVQIRMKRLPMRVVDKGVALVGITITAGRDQVLGNDSQLRIVGFGYAPPPTECLQPALEVHMIELDPRGSSSSISNIDRRLCSKEPRSAAEPRANLTPSVCLTSEKASDPTTPKPKARDLSQKTPFVQNAGS